MVYIGWIWAPGSSRAPQGANPTPGQLYKTRLRSRVRALASSLRLPILSGPFCLSFLLARQSNHFRHHGSYSALSMPNMDFDFDSLYDFRCATVVETLARLGLVLHDQVHKVSTKISTASPLRGGV